MRTTASAVTATIAIPPPGSHGGDGAQVAAALGLAPEKVLDLSASLNPVAPPLARVVVRHLDALSRYPDAAPATSALAEVLGVEPDRLVLTNGGAEAIALVAGELGTGRVDDPDFSLYRRHLDARGDARRCRQRRKVTFMAVLRPPSACGKAHLKPSRLNHLSIIEP